MTRKLLALLAALATILGLTVFSPGNASALGGEWLGCRIAPGTEFNFYQYCNNTKQAYQYSVAFVVQNETAASTYSWSITAGFGYGISGGCTTTSPSCTLSVSRGAGDREIDVSVTLTQGGASNTLYSNATIMPYCDGNYC